MAITVASNPGTFSPVYNPLRVVVTSTNSSQPNFRYVWDIYDAYTNALIIRLKTVKNGDDRGIVDLQRVVSQYVNNFNSPDTEYDSNGTAIVNCSAFPFGDLKPSWCTAYNNYFLYKINIGEEYGTTPVVYPNLTNIGPYVGINASLDGKYLKDTYTPPMGIFKLANGGSSRKFLSFSPATQSIGLLQNAWLFGAPSVDNSVRAMVIKTYSGADATGSLLQTVTVPNPYVNIGTYENRVLRFSCGPAGLNLIASSGITTGAQPIVTSSVGSYTVYTSGTTLASSETKTFNLDPLCSLNTIYRVHFMNRLGGYDSFNFKGANVESADVNRSRYTKIPGMYDSVSASFVDLANCKTDGYYDTKVKQKVSLVSDWLTDAEWTWLQELLESPDVYLDSDNSYLFSALITSSNYRVGRGARDGLVQLRLEIEYGFTSIRQRG